MLPPTVKIKVWGDFALFTRPELKVERVSYPFMTPSAARGILDAILYKPQMYWHVRRITALVPWWIPTDPERPHYRFMSILRNEIQGKISVGQAVKWMGGAESDPYLVDSAGRENGLGQNRTQRHSLVLRDVAYLIDASPLLTNKANAPRVKPEDTDEPGGPDTIAKYVGMFQRRVAKGQCFHHPYLGIREFACHFAAPTGDEKTDETWSEDLGIMLHDILFSEQGQKPLFFHAKIDRGVLHCDQRDSGPGGIQPVTLLGGNDSEKTS